MMDMAITDTLVISELEHLASSTGRDVGDLITEILREHFVGPGRRKPDPDDLPGSAAKLLAAIRADFEEVGWMELELSDRRTLP